MGEWGSVTFVHTMRRKALDRALATVLGRFGFDSASDLEVLVIAGAGWTAVKCTDAELLCKRPPRETVPAIALVSKALGRYAFQMSVYDGDSIALLEASAKGKVIASGGEASIARRFFQEERISEARSLQPKFYLLPLLPVADELRALADDGADFAEQVSALLVPRVEPFEVFTDHVMAEPRELAGAYWLSFASASRSRPPRS